MVSPFGCMAKAKKVFPSKCICGFTVNNDMSSGRTYVVVNFLIESGGTTKGGKTGEMPLVPRINSFTGLFGGLGI